jgi:hypothetical protein
MVLHTWIESVLVEVSPCKTSTRSNCLNVLSNDIYVQQENWVELVSIFARSSTVAITVHLRQWELHDAITARKLVIPKIINSLKCHLSATTLTSR